jgi:hypothetical protein
LGKTVPVETYWSRFPELKKKKGTQMAAPTKEPEKKEPEKKSKKDEPWRYKVVSGSAHPDNKEPLTKVAKASDEAAKAEEAMMDAEQEKLTRPDWAELPGGKPPEEEDEKK